MAKRPTPTKRVERKPAKLPGVTIKSDETEADVLAAAIVDVAKSARKLLGSKLSKRAITVLLNNSCKVSQADIERVLCAAANLDKTFLK